MVVLVMVLVISIFFGRTVIPVMIETVADLELSESALTRIHRFGGTLNVPVAAATMALSLAAMGLAFRWVGGAGRFRWLLGTVPLLGEVFRNLGAIDFAGMLRMMLARRVPLDRALTLVANGAADPNAADVAHRLARGVAAGRSMSQLLDESTRMPHTMVPLIGWGERHESMDQAMSLIVDTFAQRIRMQTEWIIAILPPLVYAFSAAVLVVIVGLLADTFRGLMDFFWFGF